MNPNKVYLIQTDTTIGFSTQNKNKLAQIKHRSANKLFILNVKDFKTLKEFTRIPQKFKSKIRHSKRITFVYANNKAIRVISSSVKYKTFLNKFDYMYSSSANLSGKKFNIKFAKAKADVIVEDNRGLYEFKASDIYKISKNKIKKIR